MARWFQRAVIVAVFATAFTIADVKDPYVETAAQWFRRNANISNESLDDLSLALNSTRQIGTPSNYTDWFSSLTKLEVVVTALSKRMTKRRRSRSDTKPRHSFDPEKLDVILAPIRIRLILQGIVEHLGKGHAYIQPTFAFLASQLQSSSPSPERPVVDLLSAVDELCWEHSNENSPQYDLMFPKFESVADVVPRLDRVGSADNPEPEQQQRRRRRRDGVEQEPEPIPVRSQPPSASPENLQLLRNQIDRLQEEVDDKTRRLEEASSLSSMAAAAAVNDAPPGPSTQLRSYRLILYLYIGSLVSFLSIVIALLVTNRRLQRKIDDLANRAVFHATRGDIIVPVKGDFWERSSNDRAYS